MYLIIVLIFIQIIANVIFDKTGISKKYFTSSGGFIFIVFCGIWMLCSLFISSELFPNYFVGDFWFFTFWMPWLFVLIVGPIASLVVQLIYSYLLRRFIEYKK